MTDLSDLSESDLAAAVELSISSANGSRMIELGGEYERRCIYDAAWKLLADGTDLLRPSKLPVWTGQALRGKRLVVRRKLRHLGAELRMARFANIASENGANIIIATENRLVSLFRRSFPSLRVVDLANQEAWMDSDYEASYERMAEHFGRTAEDIRHGFNPLIPPPGPAPWGDDRCIGISWFSKSTRKPQPTIGEWSDVFTNRNIRLASLQYDEDSAGIDELSKRIGRQITPSMPVDQMTNIDDFSRQVARTAGVFTISNTTAHMAGMLGVPCAVAVDDMNHLTWPAEGSSTPFYPNLTIVRQRGRPWPAVLEEASSALFGLIERVISGNVISH